MPLYTIDRFEGEHWAVLEDEQARTFRVPRNWMPDDVREGDVVKATEQPVTGIGRSIRFEVDPHARDERLAEATRRRDSLPRGPKGDISL